MCVCACAKRPCVIVCVCEKEKNHFMCLKFVLLLCFPLTREMPPSKGPSQLVCIPAKGDPSSVKNVGGV